MLVILSRFCLIDKMTIQPDPAGHWGKADVADLMSAYPHFSVDAGRQMRPIDVRKGRP